MKVLLVQKIVGIAGSELYIHELAKGLIRKGVDASLLIITNKKRENENHAFYQQLKADGINYFVIYFQVWSILSVFRKIHKLAQKEAVDILHSNLIHADLLCSMAKRWSLGGRYKLISTKHGYDQNYQGEFGLSPFGTGDGKFRWIETFAEKKIDRSYAVSKGLKDLYVAKSITPEDQIEVIYPGFVFLDQSQLENKSFRKHEMQILIVGRLIKVKGHIYLVKAASLLKEKGYQFKVVVVGGYGDLDSEIKSQIKKHDVSDVFEIIGHSAEVHQYMMNSDILVVPSLGEGFGIVILEAFNNRKPVVAFDVPACNEIIEDQKSGILVPLFNVEQLAAGIERLINNEDMRTQYGNEGYRRLKDFFNTQRMVDDVFRFYSKVVG